MRTEIIPIVLLIIMLVLYAARWIPLGAVSVLGALALWGAGILTVEEVFAQYVSDVVLLQIGVMIIGSTFFYVGLADDLGGFIQKRFSARPELFLLIIILFSSVISAFISNTATVAMLLPVISSTEYASGGKLYRKYYCMAMGFASVLGGNVALFSSTPQLAVQHILETTSTAGVRPLGVFGLAKTAIPLALLLPLFYLLFGIRMQKKLFSEEKPRSYENKEVVKTEEHRSPFRKIMVCVIYLSCIIGFIGGWIPIGVTAILGAILCVTLRLIPEKHALQSVDWVTIVMLGGILSFSSGFSKSGAGKLIADTTFGLFEGVSASPMLFFVLMILVAVLLTSVMSNTAVAVMLAPIGISLAAALHANPMTFVVGIILASNVSFCTPIATAPVTMTLNAGYRFSDYFKIGGLCTLFAAVFICILVPLVYPF